MGRDLQGKNRREVRLKYSGEVEVDETTRLKTTGSRAGQKKRTTEPRQAGGAKRSISQSKKQQPNS